MNLRHSLLYRFLRSIYIRTQSLYDKLTCSQITVHIGDILAPQGEISENQMLVYFRILDAQRFYLSEPMISPCKIEQATLAMAPHIERILGTAILKS